ncbi:MFS transporter [Enterococcus sp. AZ103]|uniref:MFS transporter n=1 Tax=Enterococcus sp. AZ103 TaxID=2774628 RepID=UPI003F25ECAE
METKKWRLLPAVIATAIMSSVGVLIETSMNVTFPTLMRLFRINTTTVQWITTSNLLALAITVPVSAFLMRNFAVKKLFITANLLFLLGVITCFLAPSFGVLVLGRIFQGTGTGIAMPLMYHIVLTKAPKNKRGTLIGLATMTTSLAPAVGPTYGGIIATSFGWRMIFLLLIPLVILSFVLGYYAMSMEKVSKHEKFNLKSFLGLAVGLASLLIAIQRVSLLWLILAIASLLTFYYFNRQNHLLDLSIFKNKKFFYFMYGSLAFQAASLGISFIFPNFLQLGLQQTATEAGLFMFPGAITVAVVAPIAGILLDKIGPFKPIASGFFLSSLALFLLIFLIGQNNIPLFLGLTILYMVGLGLAVSNVMALALTQLDDYQQDDGNSILNTLQQFSGAVSTTVVAHLFIAVPKNIATPEVFGSRNGFILLFIVLALGFLFFVQTYRKNTSPLL